MIESERKARVRQGYPHFVIEDACKIDSIDGVRRGFDLAASQGKSYPDEHPEKLSLEHISPDRVWESVSIPLLDIFVRHGWDINQRPKRTSGWGCQSRMSNLICHDDEIIHWALEHGATVSDELDKDPYRDWYIAPSLLDSVASQGSLEMMKHLYALGARPGRITLHNAVSRAGSHPTHVNMDRARYLVEELHFDVNQRDVDPEYTRPMAFGTPLMYAVKAHAVEGDGGVVVRYLLEHGADPYRRDFYGGADAFDRTRGNHAALRALEEWKVSRGLSDDRERESYGVAGVENYL